MEAVGKSIALALLLLAIRPSLSAETVTLPAVASLPAGSAAAPFFSDVRVFNTSYVSPVAVTATYRCFLGACPGPAPQATFNLEPRESRAMDDIVAATFLAPSSAGAAEFTSSGSAVRVTSRMYSTVPLPTVGMSVAGLRPAEAHAVSVLASLANGSFRTNVGMYNGNDVGVTATVRLFDGLALLGSRSVTVAPRSGTQINRIFDAVGRGELATTNAFAVVESDNASAPLFAYAAVIDNATTDPSYVSGAQDAPAPEVETVVINVRAWDFAPGGPNSPPLVLTAGTTYTLVFHNVDPPGTTNPRHGFSGISDLGLPGTDDISPGHDFVIPSFTPQPYHRGTHPFSCTQNECGGDPEQHRGMQGILVIE